MDTAIKQINIFDLINENIKNQIIKKLKKFEIDNLYKERFKQDSYTFFEIYTYLSKNKNFNDYLEALKCELKKYIKESTDCHQYKGEKYE